jgi:hypothetical protein
MCFVRLWNETVITCLKSFSQIVFVMETKCVFCNTVIRTECLRVI